MPERDGREPDWFYSLTRAEFFKTYAVARERAGRGEQVLAVRCWGDVPRAFVEVLSDRPDLVARVCQRGGSARVPEWDLLLVARRARPRSEGETDPVVSPESGPPQGAAWAVSLEPLRACALIQYPVLLMPARAAARPGFLPRMSTWAPASLLTRPPLG